MNRSCVPYALAKPLGLPVDEAAALVTDSNRTLTRIWRSKWVAAVRERMTVVAEINEPHMSLGKFAAVKEKLADPHTWLISIGGRHGHCVVLRNGIVYENGNPRERVTRAEYHEGRRQRIEYAIAVTNWSDADPYRETVNCDTLAESA